MDEIARILKLVQTTHEGAFVTIETAEGEKGERTYVVSVKAANSIALNAESSTALEDAFKMLLNTLMMDLDKAAADLEAKAAALREALAT